MTPAAQPLVIGIAGGSASGKSWLADHLAVTLGPDRCRVLPHDRYYRDHPDLSLPQRRQLNFDQPVAFDTPLLLRHLRALRSGQPIDIPSYDYSKHRRAPETTTASPAPIILVEGLFVIAVPAIRRTLDLSIFVHTPADIRLLRRIQRDTTERGQSLAEILNRYTAGARPGHERHVEPSRRHADLIWDQEHDLDFPRRLLRLLERLQPPCP